MTKEAVYVNSTYTERTFILERNWESCNSEETFPSVAQMIYLISVFLFSSYWSTQTFENSEVCVYLQETKCLFGFGGLQRFQNLVEHLKRPKRLTIQKFAISTKHFNSCQLTIQHETKRLDVNALRKIPQTLDQSKYNYLSLHDNKIQWVICMSQDILRVHFYILNKYWSESTLADEIWF